MIVSTSSRLLKSHSRPFGHLMGTSMSAVKDSVQADIKGNDVMVFSKSYCPYCTRAKEALTSRGIAFKAIELDVR